MKTIELNGEVKLTKCGRESVYRKLGTLRGLAKLLREQPLPRGEAGKAQLSILGELELCRELGFALVRGEHNAETALARFDFRHEAIVRGVFQHIKDAGLYP